MSAGALPQTPLSELTEPLASGEGAHCPSPRTPSPLGPTGLNWGGATFTF